MAYTGNSIVDYLKDVGQASDYTSRSKLAQQYGIQNYAGTAEQNTQLLNTLRSGSTNTSSTTSATNASSTTNQIQLPQQTQINPDISTAEGRISYYNQFIADEEARAAKAEADRQALIKDREAQRTKQGGIIDLLKGIGTKRTEELGALGFDPTAQFAQQKAQLAEVDSLYQDYNASVANRDKQIADVYGRPGQSMDFLNNQVAQINRNANVLLTQKSSNINSKLAVMEAQNNNWENAQKFVDQSIKDYTAGLTADYDMLSSFIDDNNDLISSLGTEYTNALNSRKSLILDQIETARKDKQQEFDNMIELKTVNSGTTNTKFWSEIDAARNELQQGESWGNVWNRVKQQFPNVPDSQIDNALGTSWREPGAFQTWSASKSSESKPEQYFTPENITDISKSLLSSYGNNVQQAKEAASVGKINIDVGDGKTKEVKLSQQQIDEIKAAIDKANSQPSWWDSVKQNVGWFWQGITSQ